MKAVLISIQPKWCRLILSGKKTVEIRRSCPQLEAPFKVYIYCTLSGSNELFREDLCGDIAAWNRECWTDRKGNVIAEFTCSQIIAYDFAEMFEPPDWEVSLGDQYYIPSGDLENSCLSYEELLKYGQEQKLFGWHISDLKVYDKPKVLSVFFKECVGLDNTGLCYECENAVGEECDCALNGQLHLARPPQSWCYVEELP